MLHLPSEIANKLYLECKKLDYRRNLFCSYEYSSLPWADVNLYRKASNFCNWRSVAPTSPQRYKHVGLLCLGEHCLLQSKNGANQEKKSTWLEHGSVLLLLPGFLYRVPKVTKGWCGERLILTFTFTFQ